MSRAAIANPLSPVGTTVSPQIRFASITIALMLASAGLAGWAPLGFSIVTVFLFAGPHNWIELRYFMSRMPARWGPLRGFFLFAFAGIFGLTATFAALPWLAGAGGWQAAEWNTAIAVWNTALV